jgi:hypothetical protein
LLLDGLLQHALPLPPLLLLPQVKVLLTLAVLLLTPGLPAAAVLLAVLPYSHAAESVLPAVLLSLNAAATVLPSPYAAQAVLPSVLPASVRALVEAYCKAC